MTVAKRRQSLTEWRVTDALRCMGVHEDRVLDDLDGIFLPELSPRVRVHCLRRAAHERLDAELHGVAALQALLEWLHEGRS